MKLTMRQAKQNYRVAKRMLEEDDRSLPPLKQWIRENLQSSGGRQLSPKLERVLLTAVKRNGT